MVKPHRFLEVSVVAFKVLAWFVLAVLVVRGLIMVIQGGEPMIIGGLDMPIPARLLGLLTCVWGGMYFFSFWLTSSLIRLLLDIYERFGGSERSMTN